MRPWRIGQPAPNRTTSGSHEARTQGLQRDFFQRVRERDDSGVTRQLGVLATGLGKAVLFAALREQMNFQRKIMVLVHREELANQAADKFQRWNPDLMVGVEKAERTSNPMDTFIVASVPTLGRRGSTESGVPP